MKKHRLTTQELVREELMEELKKAQNALDSAYSVFENVTEPDLIDCAIYQINAIQLRYKYLLERAKQFMPREDSEISAQPILITAATATAAEAGIYKYSELASF